MLDILAQIDILGLSTLLGSLLFLGGLLWLLLDNRSFEELNRRHAAGAEPPDRASARDRAPSADRPADPAPTDADHSSRPSPPSRPPRPSRPSRPSGPSRPRRAA